MGNLRVGWLNLDQYQTPQDTRLISQMAWMGNSTGPLLVRSGLVGGPDAAMLTGATAMECDIAPFMALIAGSEAGDQGAYPVVLRTQERLAFTAGEPAINRVDRVVAHVYDNDYDATGLYDGDVEVLVGDAATGAASALPPDTLPLWSVTVPAGASAGGSGIPWASAVQSDREWTTTLGGSLPVADKAGRDLIDEPGQGMSVVRLDLGVTEIWDGSDWRTQGVPVLASTADATKLDQYEGQAAVFGTDMYVRRSGEWEAMPRGLLAAVQSFSVWPNGATDGVITDLTVVGGGTAAQQTLPMTFAVDLDVGRTYKLEGWIDTVDTDVNGTWYRAWIKRVASGGNVLTGTTVAVAYGFVTSSTFGSTEGSAPVGYVAGVGGPTTFALMIERFNGSGKLRVGGHYNLAVSDVGPASALVNG